MNHLTLKCIFCFCVALSATSIPATLYWDINGATAGAGGASPSGIWDAATTANWSSSSAGTVATVVWTSGDSPQFSAGTDATGPFTVTVNGNVNVNTIRMEEAGTVTFA